FFEPRCGYAVAECIVEAPRLEPVSDTHAVRCHRRLVVLAESTRERRPANPAASTGAADALLTVRGLNAAHRSRPVVFDLDFVVKPKQCVALVGESGSGKTTLARCVAGLHANFTGELALRGRPLAAGARARNKETRREIQYVFQSPYSSLNPRKTVGQIVGQ